VVDVDVGQIDDQRPGHPIVEAGQDLRQPLPLIVDASRIDEGELLLRGDDVRVGGEHVDGSDVGVKLHPMGAAHRL